MKIVLSVVWITNSKIQNQTTKMFTENFDQMKNKRKLYNFQIKSVIYSILRYKVIVMTKTNHISVDNVEFGFEYRFVEKKGIFKVIYLMDAVKHINFFMPLNCISPDSHWLRCILWHKTVLLL